MKYEDFIINCFCFVDDVLRYIGNRHKTNKPKFSDYKYATQSELITFLIYTMLLFRHGDYKAALKEFKEHYSHLFLYIPNLPAIVKRAKKIMYLVNIILVLIRNTKIPIKIMVAIVDSKPQVCHGNIPVCKNQRMKRCKKVKGPLYKGNNGLREWTSLPRYLALNYAL